MHTLIRTIFRKFQEKFHNVKNFNNVRELGNFTHFLPPYGYVQKITEQYVHRYLNLKNSDIKNWFIVGGCQAS